MLNSPKWEDWDVRVALTEGDRLGSLYLSPKHSSSDPDLRGTRQQSTTFLVLAENPVLCLLGLRLVEIAFGQTLAETRKEDIKLAVYEPTLDENSKDLLAARQMLATRLIEKRFGKNFEDVVNVCLNQQYRQIKGADVVDMDPRDSSFLERATTCILLPLYQEMQKYIR